MKWVTRKNAKVDRIASPWLVRRFVDPDADFLLETPMYDALYPWCQRRVAAGEA
jgi:hypothetical protein